MLRKSVYLGLILVSSLAAGNVVAGNSSSASVQVMDEAVPPTDPGVAPEQIISGQPETVSSRLECGAGAALLTKYVWRGLNLTNCPVLQPSVSVGGGGFGFNIWGNIDLDQANGMAGQVNELDYTLNYSFSVKNYSLSLGAIHYSFPGTEFNSTTEFTFGLGLNTFLSPTATVYKDVDESDGTYVSLSFSHSLPLEKLNNSLDLACALGWGSKKNNGFYYGAAESSVADIYLGASLPFTVWKKYSLAPSVGYAGLLSSRIRSAVEKKGHFSAGVTLSAEF